MYNRYILYFILGKKYNISKLGVYSQIYLNEMYLKEIDSKDISKMYRFINYFVLAKKLNINNAGKYDSSTKTTIFLQLDNDDNIPYDFIEDCKSTPLLLFKDDNNIPFIELCINEEYSVPLYTFLEQTTIVELVNAKDIMDEYLFSEGLKGIKY